MYLPWISEIPMYKGISWRPTWKSLPNDDRRFWKDPKPEPNVFSSLKYELAAFAGSARLFDRKKMAWHPGALWSWRTLYPLDYSYNTMAVREDLCFFHNRVKPVLEGFFKHLSALGPHPGRLTCTLSGAGKRRLFAIGNYVRQRLLHPVHSWAMRVLSRIPNDGTFNQEGPIHRLSRFCPTDVLSFDLSSATDRWPVLVLTEIFGCFFGQETALCVVNGTLWCNVFHIHRPLLRKARFVYFAAGQPLGYYGSWALFSLSHHFMVWLAAWYVYPRRTAPFRKYALLGDDIVIADRAVAERYKALLDTMDVSISESKSIDSKTGALEFAKQFWVDRVQVNLTPVSAKAILASSSLIGLCQLAEKYNLSMRCLVRLAGAGYRVRGRMLSTRLSRRWKRLRVVADRSLSYYRLPLDLWFGRGNPMNPYLKGIIIDRVRAKYKPKQLVLIPSNHLWYVGEEDLLDLSGPFIANG
ncbi:uncharacterized protein LOC141823102 [Curcuma longa]|uniref:uncharacterized protein LOC141823102 n=1 Tax=Curcuma longa TaxID=136217 RepID=UPI003D9E57A2